MDQMEYTELEQVLQRTVEKQSQRIANLMLDLDLAHSQIQIMREKEEAALDEAKEIVEEEKPKENTKKK